MCLPNQEFALITSAPIPHPPRSRFVNSSTAVWTHVMLCWAVCPLCLHTAGTHQNHLMSTVQTRWSMVTALRGR